MKAIQYTELAPGLRISKVLTGLWQIADMERDGQLLDPHRTAEAMLPYVQAGLSTFDMADHYGSAEVIAGTFQKKYGLQYPCQMLTKWVPKPGKCTKEEVRAAVQHALDRLQTAKIDLLQFHCWNYLDPVWLDQLFWLQELKEEGLIGYLGLTNFDAAHLRMVCATGIPVVSNQVCHSLIDGRAAGEMAEVCREFGVKILAFGTLAGGFLSDKWLGREEPSIDNGATWSQMKYMRFIDAAGGWDRFQSLLQDVEKVARKHGVSIANVATKYIMDQDFVGGVIIGARLGQSAHIEETLQLFSFELDEEDRKVIHIAAQALDPIPGDCGDEYRKPPFLTASGDLSHHLDAMPKPYEMVHGPGGTVKVFSGTPWEGMAGYCRAVRKGNRISVSGTTATHGDKMIGGKDPAAQATFVLDKIEGAIVSLGGKLEDVIQTRIFVNDVDSWEPVAKAHGKRFVGIQPANTLVEAKLVGEGYLVEIEAEAEL
ncbi:aldo/keto reductase [Cecembia calidifontis]|uniref:Aryl-alcohol dehydrogenase-like predicted oxidoreductase n=1 Tax=Cecembia calidifontis TaxID=1187080 RepID=A0A4Q7P5M3_9BACT|nr:aldo/keto reductase [Cecembia calidifontis]RZS95235.1 aryl-alcohol dehydrogenase-like predicted oxidoreductase [Cecembia calidifontis]